MTSGCVVALGDPVTDVIVEVSHDDLCSITQEPGGCCTIDADELASLVSELTAARLDSVNVPGGSAANVVSCMAELSKDLQCIFIGGVGADSTADTYKACLQAKHVVPHLIQTSVVDPSAVSVCLITPDGQRTMRTCLGAAQKMTAAHLPGQPLGKCRLMHCEGYCLYKPDLAMSAMQQAKAGGAIVSLDLASFEVIRNCLGTLLSLLRSKMIDIVFCNEDEASALRQAGLDVTDDAEGIEDTGTVEKMLLRYCKLAVFTMGSKGARAYSCTGHSASACASTVDVQDTVGAGDYFCGAFLAAHLLGGSLQQCCRAGCAAGSRVVQCVGASLSAEAKTHLKSEFWGILRETP